MKGAKIGDAWFFSKRLGKTNSTTLFWLNSPNNLHYIYRSMYLKEDLEKSLAKANAACHDGESNLIDMEEHIEVIPFSFYLIIQRN